MLRSLMLRLALALCLAGVAAAPLQAAGEKPSAATKPVDRLTTTLLDTMKQAKDLGFEGRFAKLEPVLRETFDFDFMARLSVGRHWRSLTPEQQDKFVDHFAQLSVATFAARFDGYSGQTWEVLSPRDGPRNTVLVPTRLAKAADNGVTISYLMRENDTDWRAVDVYLKGTYSELATKRSEYSSIIKREGFPALLDTMADKIEELSRSGTGGETSRS